MPVNMDITETRLGKDPDLSGIVRRMDDTGPAWEVIGETVETSIQQNFEEGGRPEKWVELKASTIAEREREGKWPGKILVRHGATGLAGSVSYTAYNDKVVVHGNSVYAAIHNFGGMAGPGRSVEIRKREFMMLQGEDYEEVKDTLRRYTTRGEV